MLLQLRALLPARHGFPRRSGGSESPLVGRMLLLLLLHRRVRTGPVILTTADRPLHA
jgi:hypothetical protein